MLLTRRHFATILATVFTLMALPTPELSLAVSRPLARIAFPSAPVTKSAATDAVSNIVRVTTSSRAVTDAEGRVYIPTTGFEGGWVRTDSVSRDIPGTDSDELYRSIRFNPAAWKHQMPNGTYRVLLRMRDVENSVAGKRLFHVQANGLEKLRGVDIAQNVGINRAYDCAFQATVTNGFMKISFIPVVGTPVVSAIEISPLPVDVQQVSRNLQLTVADRLVRDEAGTEYSPASSISGGSRQYVNAPFDVGHTNSDELYKFVRTGVTSLSAPLAKGRYRVLLKMRDHEYAGPGMRVFDVDANGARRLHGIDVAGSVGQHTAYDSAFEIDILDEGLRIEFVPRVGAPVLSAVDVTSLDSGITRNPPSGSETSVTGVPSPGSEADFTRLVFADEFDSVQSIDLNGTGRLGYKWYTDMPFGWPDPLVKASSHNGYITLQPDAGRYNNGNWSISTVSPTTNAGQAFKFGYFEARMRFVQMQENSVWGWPSFWGISRNRVINRSNDRYAELDFFESSGNGTLFNGSIHDWSLDSESRDFATRMNSGTNLHPVDAKFDDWNRFGCLWEPGRVVWYLNDKVVGEQKYSATESPYPNPNGHPVGTFSIHDRDELMVILGSAEGWPLDIDYVKIWQTKGA